MFINEDDDQSKILRIEQRSETERESEEMRLIEKIGILLELLSGTFTDQLSKQRESVYTATPDTHASASEIQTGESSLHTVTNGAFL